MVNVLMPKTGTYVVVLKSAQARTVQIGRLAQLAVRRGYYVYVGSALGPGGVRARLRHHAKVSRRQHWHLDYLRAETAFYAAYAGYSPERKECEWASILATGEGVTEPMSGFGSSDCRCNSHLFYFSSALKLRRAIRAIPAAKVIDSELLRQREGT